MATWKARKVARKLKEIFKVVLDSAKKVINKAQEMYKSYRERIKELTGDDPFTCPNCGKEMVLWEIWVPEYGKIYNELEEIRSGKYAPIEFEEKSKKESRRRFNGRNGATLWRGDNILQLSLY